MERARTLLESANGMRGFLTALSLHKMAKCDNENHYRPKLRCLEEDVLFGCDMDYLRGDRGFAECFISVAPSPGKDRILNDFLIVWENGNWCKRGPWQSIIEKRLADLIVRLDAVKKEAKETKKAKKIAKEKAEKERYAALVAAWSPSV